MLRAFKYKHQTIYRFIWVLFHIAFVDLLDSALLQSSFTQVWALYKLATNPDVQERLRSEVQEVVGSADIVTPDHIAKMPYLKDTIKETLRSVIPYQYTTHSEFSMLAINHVNIVEALQSYCYMGMKHMHSAT